MPWRGTTFLRKPTLVYCNINDLQPIPTPQLLKISQEWIGAGDFRSFWQAFVDVSFFVRARRFLRPER
jgi:hypothetical protein